MNVSFRTRHRGLEWHLAHTLGEFRLWLEQGALSEDAVNPAPVDFVKDLGGRSNGDDA